jgi:hypothetical protein
MALIDIIQKGRKMRKKKTSKKTGIEVTNISKMENGERKIGETVANKLGKALNVCYKVFFGITFTSFSTWIC